MNNDIEKKAKRKNRKEQEEEGKFHIDTVIPTSMNDYIVWRMQVHPNIRSKNASVRGCVEVSQTLEQDYPPNCVVYIVEPNGEVDPENPGKRRDKIWTKTPLYAFFK